MWNRSAVVLLVATAGCIDSNLVVCGNGLACPVNERCDEIHLTCVLPEQLVVCAAAAEGADCTTGPVSGGCFDGVCLPRGCGNRVLEAGEMCDDGNQISGDGCNGICTSTEVCGNGFVDPGEACDDGALISHDGCDSRCAPEEAAWSPPIAISPSLLPARAGAYDPLSQRLVFAQGNATWEWDGARWTRSASERLPEVVFYDPDRGEVAMIGLDGWASPHLYAWRDGQWRQADTTEQPALEDSVIGATATYDTTRHRAVVVIAGAPDTTAVWAIDAAGAWSPLPELPAAVPTAIAAYDAAADQIVMETPDATEWVFDGDGVAWASAATGFGPVVSMVFDPVRGHLVLVDGQTGAMYERIGDAWSAVDTAAMPCARADSYDPPLLYHDPERDTLEVFSSDARQQCSFGESWTSREPEVPFLPFAAAFDPVSRQVMILHNAHPEHADARVEAWVASGNQWRLVHVLGAAAGATSAHAMYSAGRAATVLYGERARTATPDGGPIISDCSPYDRVGDTWTSDGSGWQWVASLSSATPPCTRSAATYDPEHHRVLLVTYDELWSLADGDDAWTQLAPPSMSGQISSVAWDARNGALLAARFSDDGVTSPLSELHGTEWRPVEVTPIGFSSGSTVLVGNERSGGVLVVGGAEGGTWERTGADWVKLPEAPITAMYAAWAAYNPVDGSVLLIGRSEDGVFASTLTRSSATPFETCAAGEDADGDGLAGCDDPDCYWACSRCVPHTSCP